jgi:membrane fusion protein, multidrug efflux system
LKLTTTENRHRMPLTLLVAFGLAAAGCGHEDTAPATPPAMEVGVTSVTVRDVPEVLELVGQTVGSSDVEVRPRTDGVVTAMNFKEGSLVQAGDVLYEIDPSEVRERVAAAQGRLAAAQTRQADAANQRRRYEPLARINAISKLDLERAQAAEKAAAGEVEAALAQLELTRINLGYATVKAPISGLAGMSNVKVGDYVGGASTTGSLTTVSIIDPINVRFSISERDYLGLARRFPDQVGAGGNSNVKRTTRLELVLADGTTFDQKGTINFADRQIDPQTGTLTIEATFPNPQGLLRPGQFARVLAPIAVRKDALLVPQRAVVEIQGIYHVYVAADGKADMRRVVPGQRVDSLWVIEQGIGPGDKIIVEGLQRLRSGAPITARDVPAPAAPATPAGQASTAR